MATGTYEFTVPVAGLRLEQTEVANGCYTAFGSPYGGKGVSSEVGCGPLEEGLTSLADLVM